MATFASKYVPMLTAAVDYAKEHSEWVVLVTPKGILNSVQAALTAVRPLSAKMVGRTTLLPGGGRVTVTSGESQIFGARFLVMFLGFSNELTPRDQIAFHTWRQQAEGVVTPGEHPGTLEVSR